MLEWDVHNIPMCYFLCFQWCTHTGYCGHSIYTLKNGDLFAPSVIYFYDILVWRRTLDIYLENPVIHPFLTDIQDIYLRTLRMKTNIFDKKGRFVSLFLGYWLKLCVYLDMRPSYMYLPSHVRIHIPLKSLGCMAKKKGRIKCEIRTHTELSKNRYAIFSFTIFTATYNM